VLSGTGAGVLGVSGTSTTGGGLSADTGGSVDLSTSLIADGSFGGIGGDTGSVDRSTK
jgi:hypothetical protein